MLYTLLLSPNGINSSWGHFPLFCRFLATLTGTNRKADIDFSSSTISISSDLLALLICGGGKDEEAVLLLEIEV